MINELQRRRFLKGAGVCLALPLFESLAGRNAQAGGEPDGTQRLVVIGHPNGTPQPAGEMEMAPGLRERLAPMEGRYSVVQNLDNSAIKYGQINTGVGTPHSGCFHGFLSGEMHEGIGNERMTFDQRLAADPRHQGARASSLSINCNKRPSAQLGVPQQWFNTWAWQGPGQPVGAHHDPRAVFDLLFAGFEPEDDPAARALLEQKRLYLDAVLDQIHDLQPKLNSTDQVRLDQYLTGVEELDRKTASILDGGLAQCTVGERPEIELNPDAVAPPASLYPEVVDAMFGLLTLALQCDATRLVTFAFASPAGGGSVTGMNFVPGLEGIESGWHPLSHWSAPYGNLSNDTELNRRDFERIIGWHYDKVVGFVQSLDSLVDAQGRSLLDDTLVSFGSWMGSAVHDPRKLYNILFGTGGGAFAEGLTINANERNIADLWVSVMKGFGNDPGTLGIGQTGMDEILI